MSNKRYQEFIEVLKKNIGEGKIKVSFDIVVDGEERKENLWATPIGSKYAKIDNIPFYVENVSMNDIVRIIPDEHNIIKKFDRLINRATYKVDIIYDYGIDEYDVLKHRECFRKLVEFFERDRDCLIEGAIANWAVVAIPVKYSIEEAIEIIEEAPNIEAYQFAKNELIDESIDEEFS